MSPQKPSFQQKNPSGQKSLRIGLAEISDLDGFPTGLYPLADNFSFWPSSPVAAQKSS